MLVVSPWSRERVPTPLTLIDFCFTSPYLHSPPKAQSVDISGRDDIAKAEADFR